MNNLQTAEKGLWKTGKDEYKKFVNMKLTKKTNIVSLLMGILFTAIIILPIACLAFEIVELYWYKTAAIFAFVSVAWGLLLVCNGLSSYITVKMVQAYETDMLDVQKIDAKAIFFYQTFNIGFALVTLILLGFILVSALSL